MDNSSITKGSKKRGRSPKRWAGDVDSDLHLINSRRSYIMNRVVWGVIVKEAPAHSSWNCYDDDNEYKA